MRSLLLLTLVLFTAGFRQARGRGAEVFIMGDRVTFFFSMREVNPGDTAKRVVWQRWQLSCGKSGICGSLNLHMLEDAGAGAPCSVRQDPLVGARFQVKRFDLAAGEVVVNVHDALMGAGDLRISFDPKSMAMTKAEADLVLKGDPEEGEEDEVRRFRMPAASAIIKPACVFLEEGAGKLPSPK